MCKLRLPFPDSVKIEAELNSASICRRKNPAVFLFVEAEGILPGKRWIVCKSLVDRVSAVFV